jgi:hypothetical protein
MPCPVYKCGPFAATGYLSAFLVDTACYDLVVSGPDLYNVAVFDQCNVLMAYACGPGGNYFSMCFPTGWYTVMIAPVNATGSPTVEIRSDAPMVSINGIYSPVSGPGCGMLGYVGNGNREILGGADEDQIVVSDLWGREKFRGGKDAYLRWLSNQAPWQVLIKRQKNREKVRLFLID